MRLEGKVALITGAASGMGRAMAILFAKEGAKVTVADVNEVGGQETVRIIQQGGGIGQFVRADVSKTTDIQNMIKTTVDAYGKLDVLCNNAGIPQARTPIENVDEEVMERILSINFKGVYLGCKYAVPVMKKQGNGVIINTSSIQGTNPTAGLSAYGASKGGVCILTKALALELARNNIRVNCVSPVATDTPMLKGFQGRDTDLTEEEKEKGGAAYVPLGRYAKPEDIAYAALYLASDESLMVTGHNLKVSGGTRL